MIPGLAWSRPLQVVKPEKYILTDQCQKRDNWQMVICNDNYGKVSRVDTDAIKQYAWLAVEPVTADHSCLFNCMGFEIRL